MFGFIYLILLHRSNFITSLNNSIIITLYNLQSFHQGLIPFPLQSSITVQTRILSVILFKTICRITLRLRNKRNLAHYRTKLLCKKNNQNNRNHRSPRNLPPRLHLFIADCFHKHWSRNRKKILIRILRGKE